MIDHCIPRCPHCHGELKFERGARLMGKCASSSEHGIVHDAILERVTEIYNDAFDDEIEATKLIC